MAAVITDLTSGSRIGTSAPTTASTASVTPTSTSGALFLAITHSISGGATVSSVTGLGLTWAQISTQVVSASTHVDIWYATYSSTPAAGAVTITFNVAAVSAIWDLIQADNADTATPYVAANTSTSTGSAVTASSLTYVQACNLDNLLYFACGANSNITQIPSESPTAWAELSDNSATGPGCAMETQLSPSNPGTGPASSTLSASVTYRAIGIEINSATPAAIYTTIRKRITTHTR